jgi:probable F420-dependent oxidoreductase
MIFTYHATMCPPEQYIPLAIEAEKQGFQGFTLPDSVCYPKEADTKYPYNADGSRNFLEDVPFLDPFCAITAMGAVTKTLRFSTSVVKLPIRNPVLVAKQAATVAVMTNNRFAFGVGLSPWQEDFDICGEPWQGRGKRFEEMIEIIRGLLSGDYFGYESEFYQIPPCKICPVPDKSIPILIGAHAEPALKRAARIADGWIHAGGTIADLRGYIEKINSYRKEYGTDQKAFEIHAMTEHAYSPEGVSELAEAGVTECIIGFRNPYEGEQDLTTVAQKVDMMKWYADEVISRYSA